MGRAPCCDKANVKRGPWSPEEDQILRSYIEVHGNGGNWIALPRKAGLNRCGKSCRLRWLNYLRPDIKRSGFTEEEADIICSLYIQLGSRWSIIASHLHGRTDNDVKNYWNTKLKKKLMPTHTVNQTPPPAVHLEVNYSIGTDSIFAMSGKDRHRLYSPLSTSSSLMLEQRYARSKNNEQQGSAASSTVVNVDESSSSSSSAMGHWSWPAGEDDMLLTEFDMRLISELLATPREVAPPLARSI